MNSIENKLLKQDKFDLADFLNLSKESFKAVQKIKMLFKTKIERENQIISKTLSQIRFNKLELMFLLDNNKNIKYYKSITIKVENELNKEVFILDDKEIICKL